MRRLPVLALVALALILTGCGPKAPGEKNMDIVDADEALELVEDGALLVDVQDFLRYNRAHVAGAVNVSRADIVINYPIPGIVAPPEQIEDVMSYVGIGPDTLVIAYDDNANMDAARLWWTLKYYGHDLVKVVSGGFVALEEAGAEVTSEMPNVEPAVFTASAPRDDMRIEMTGVREQVEDPDRNTVLLDVRSIDEVEEGTIPGSICLNYTGNNYPDGTYRPVSHIRIRYLEEGIDYDDRVIVYCVTSMRAAQTYLALYNAGYRDILLYDGGWVEWSADPDNPVQAIEQETVQPSTSDIS